MPDYHVSAEAHVQTSGSARLKTKTRRVSLPARDRAYEADFEATAVCRIEPFEPWPLSGTCGGEIA